MNALSATQMMMVREEDQLFLQLSAEATTIRCREAP
jgi:hypothetical protein